MKNKIITALMIMLMALMTGCGGGGSGDDAALSAPSVSSSAAPAETAASTDPAQSSYPAIDDSPVETTADLKASEAFAFTSFSQISVDIALIDYESVSAYVTICRGFEDTGDAFRIDLGSCLLQSPLVDGRFKGTLSLTNDIDDLIIAVWRFDGSTPETYFWSRSSDSNTIKI